MTIEEYFLGSGIAFLGFFLLKLVLEFSGMGGDDFDADLETETESEHTSYVAWFTFQNVLSFGLGFSWSGYASLKSGWSEPVVYLVSITWGLTFTWIIWKVMKMLRNLESDYTTSRDSLVGTRGEVYLSIGANRSSKGSVIVDHGGRSEITAYTDDEVDLSQGTPVVITKLMGHNVLCSKEEV